MSCNASTQQPKPTESEQPRADADDVVIHAPSGVRFAYVEPGLGAFAGLEPITSHAPVAVGDIAIDLGAGASRITKL